MALHIIVTKKEMKDAFATLCNRCQGISKKLIELKVPVDEHPLQYARNRLATSTKAFGVEIQGKYLEAFKRANGLNGNRRAFIIIS